MPTCIEGPKKLPIQHCVIVKAGGRNVVRKPELLGQLTKWAVEVSEFDIEYKPRTAIKLQVLSDFVAGLSLGLMPLAAKEAVLVSGVWTLFTNRAFNVKGSGLGVVLITPSVKTLRKAIRVVPLTNIEMKCDSQLMVNQVYGIFDIKEGHLKQYLNKVQALLTLLHEWIIVHILREENVEADTLANLLLHSVLDVDSYCEINSINLIWDWRNRFIEYLRHGKLPEDLKPSRALQTKETRYYLVDGKLYRRSFQGPLARCLGASEADYLMREVHERVCENHTGVDSLVL
ncbi:uncharacterized protein LOC142177212 [Nicotiana tabacum]|uniref:Uncharacterized protein LOC142177212 n=1 Tax=Nicotiana tabacum TaxID=4097 RepID=A0AC58TX59_TOBAC